MMRRLLLVALLIAIVAAVVALFLWPQPDAGEEPLGDQPAVVLSVGADVETTADAEQKELMLALAGAAGGDDSLGEVTIDYPLDESIFPPEMVAPTFLWHDDSGAADRWVIEVALGDGSARVYVLAGGDPPPQGWEDPRCYGTSNKPYEPTPYQASAKSWTPDEDVWRAVKAQSAEQPATVTILGFCSDRPDRPLSRGSMTLTTSGDPVDGMIFYRDVPLMPSRTEVGVIKPLVSGALPLIEWRLRDISRLDSRIVLADMPTCGNCHSFSTDGRTLGMDIDGPTGDKGAYAIADIQREMVITDDQLITWNDFPDKPAGHKTIGFGSQVSPDGRYAVTTVNETVYVRNFLTYGFLQVFYPTRGILGVYDRQAGEMKALPGADDTDYVHCDPVWSPKGDWLVFARAAARDNFEPGRPLPEFADDPNELPMQYDLYRIEFDGGAGGQPVAIEGASGNGMSNTFPKVSPDGKWIVFVKCRNGQLMRPDSELWIVPSEGGQARRMRCNTNRMNSWHSFSPNGRWMVFSSKANTYYTQMFLTHIDEEGNDSPPILIPNATAANRAVNLPEFVNLAYDDLVSIEAPVTEYYRHFTRGSELMMEGYFPEAIAEFETALASEPESTRINNNLAACLVYLGRLDEAVARFEESLRTDPRDTVALGNIAGIHAMRGRPGEAVDLYRKVLALDPNSIDAHVGMANLHARQGDTEQAVEWCRQALVIEPASGMVYHVLGNILDKAGRPGQAMANWRKAIEVDPNYAGPYASLAVAMEAQGQRGEAIGLYRSALNIEPRNVLALNNLGRVLAQDGHLDEAIELFVKALEVNPNYAPARQNLEIARRQKDESGSR